MNTGNSKQNSKQIDYMLVHTGVRMHTYLHRSCMQIIFSIGVLSFCCQFVCLSTYSAHNFVPNDLWIWNKGDGLLDIICNLMVIEGNSLGT